MASERFMINPPKRSSRLSRTSKLSKHRRLRSNPFGSSLAILGANPRRKERVRLKKRLRSMHRGHLATRDIDDFEQSIHNPRRKSKVAKSTTNTGGAMAKKQKKASKGGKVVAAVAPKKRRKGKRSAAARKAARKARKMRKAAAKAERKVSRKGKRKTKKSKTGQRVALKGLKRYIKRGRRVKIKGTVRLNPATSAFTASNFTGINFKAILPIAAIGGASIIATKLAPTLLAKYVGTSTLAQYGVKAGVAVGGGFAIKKLTKNDNYATTWVVSGLAVIAADLLSSYVLPKLLPATFPAPSVAGFSAFVQDEGLSAFVPDEQLSGGVGSDGLGEFAELEEEEDEREEINY